MNSSIYRRGLLATLATLCLGCVFAAAATAAYNFDPVLSLTGNCNESAIDPIPDPGCPYPPPPNGPSGRFNEPRSIAVDLFGNEYVASYAGDGSKGRIDVFDDEGNFITELADPHGPQSVAVDSKGNLYAFEQVSGVSAEVVRYTPSVYKPESGEIAYGNPRVVIDTDVNRSTGGVSVDFSNDHLFATNSGNSVREYSSAAEGNNLLDTITHEKLNSVNWVAVDGQRRRLFVSYCKEAIFKCGVLVFNADAPHELLEEIDGSKVPAGKFLSTKGWTSIAVDEETGNIFIDDLEQSDNVYVFDENYEYLETITSGGFQGGNAMQIAVSNDPTAFNHQYLFVPVLVASGRAIAFAGPGVGPLPPEIEGETVGNISETEVELRATVDPNNADADYAFEYVTEAQFEAEGFANASVGGEGTVSGEDLPQEVNALLKGLTPGTTYRFRISAENEAGEDEAEGTFTTYSDAAGSNECPNQALRTGLSALLPDCRAYELVTPADMNGRPPKGIGFTGDRFTTVETSPSGNAVSFLTEGGALPGMGGSGAFDGDLYRSVRGSAGWTTATAGPSGDEASLPLTGSTSPDQGFVFWGARGEGSAVIVEGAHYVRYPDGHSELVGRGSLGTDAQAEGTLITENGSHVIFQTQNIPNIPPVIAQQLEKNAPPTGTTAVYDRTADEVTHVVSLLPGDVTPAAGEDADYVGASADGNGIAFSIGKKLYLRVGNAATYEIGEDVDFAGISEGGERIFYVEGGDLLAFDTNSKEAIAFSAVGNAVPVNVAPDGTRAYFVSTSALGGENPNGAVAQAGQQNLYLSEEGEVSFVATVTARDVEGEANSVGAQVDGLGLWTLALEMGQLSREVSRLTPDGSVLLFQSRANLDGYDPEGEPQIYRYDSAANRLHCISCIPTKAAASGGASLETFAEEQLTSPPFSIYGFVTNLTSDGKRAFFESEEALVSTDTDDVKDVYEWEEQGVGSCTRAGGCLYLISSGQSTRENFLYAVSRSGDDVFFITEDVLVPGDESTLSIYDARVGGGFPATPEEECIGEGCKAPLTSPPALTPPAKPAPGAEDNIKPAPKPRTCPKGKRKVKRHGKVRCVKKHHHTKHKAGTTRRAGR